MIISSVIVAFLLHLYQPPTQDESVFRQIYDECYFPLLKFIKNNKSFSVTLNMPLSFLEQMDRYGYIDWINNVKELVISGRVEITGSAAYHPILTKIDQNSVLKQIILNEYSLGYYFGEHKGFEGENSLLVRDLNGFFPPELALNSELIEILDEAGYTWVISEKNGIEDSTNNAIGSHIYTLGNRNIRIVTRDSFLSNLVGFKKNQEANDINEIISKRYKEDDISVIALDAESFGHHNKEGLYLLSQIVDYMHNKGIVIKTVNDLISLFTPKMVKEYKETNWSVVSSDSGKKDLYDLWDCTSNKIHTILWKLLKEFEKDLINVDKFSSSDGYEILPIWINSKLDEIQDKTIRDNVRDSLLLLKSQNSDQFWWSSKKLINEKELFMPGMVFKNILIYKEIIKNRRIAKLENFLLESEVKLKELLI